MFDSFESFPKTARRRVYLNCVISLGSRALDRSMAYGGWIEH